MNNVLFKLIVLNLHVFVQNVGTKIVHKQFFPYLLVYMCRMNSNLIRIQCVSSYK